MKRLYKHSAGFTVVEILIVIVIIAILAAISIISFTGIRNKAIISSLELGASAYMQAIKAYRAEFGHFPLEKEGVVYAYGNVPVYGFCVGHIDSYPQPEKGCGGWTLNGPPTNVHLYKPTDGFHREILKTIAEQAAPTFHCFYVAGNGSCARGYVFLPAQTSYPSKLDGVPRSFFGFFLPGRTPCRLRGELAMTNKPMSADIIEFSANYTSKLGRNYTYQNDRMTLCLYAL